MSAVHVQKLSHFYLSLSVSRLCGQPQSHSCSHFHFRFLFHVLFCVLWFFSVFLFRLFFREPAVLFSWSVPIFGLIIVLLIVVGLAQVFCSTSLCKTQPLLGSASRARHALYVENRMNDIVNITMGLCESLNWPFDRIARLLFTYCAWFLTSHSLFTHIISISFHFSCCLSSTLTPTRAWLSWNF